MSEGSLIFSLKIAKRPFKSPTSRLTKQILRNPQLEIQFGSSNGTREQLSLIKLIPSFSSP